MLTDNELTGTISKFVGSMPNLVVLDVRNNIFTGALPQELEQLSKLGKLLHIFHTWMTFVSVSENVVPG